MRKETEMQYREIYAFPFIATLFKLVKILKQLKWPSMDEWIKKMWYVYTHTHTHTSTKKHYLAMIKKDILPFAMI